MDQTFAMQLVQLGIEEGDIIQIDVEGERIVKIGISEEKKKKKKVEITKERVLPLPKGKVLKEKEFVYVISLHQLDLARARSGMDIISIFFGERKEVDNEIRKEVDELVKRMVQEGKAELVPGVIFIDECSLLDIETYAFLNRALEQELAPIIIFATNRGIAKIRGTDQESPHAMPLDLLDRVLIITTKPYNKEEIRKILEIRVEEEKVKIEKEALDYLTEIGLKASLRYAIQLIAPSNIIAKENGREKISKEDVEIAEKLFVDVKRSSKYLKQFEKKFLEY